MSFLRRNDYSGWTLRDKDRFPRGRRYIQKAIFALALLFCIASRASATSPDATPQSSSGSVSPQAKVTVLLDRLPIRFPTEPYLDDGVTMVPLRALAESLGVTVQWDATTSEAICSRDGVSIRLKIGENVARYNDTEYPLPRPVALVSGNTVVPLRFFSEIMGYTVSWEEDTRTVLVSSPKRPSEIWGFYALGSLTYSSWQDLFGDKYPYVSEKPPASEMAGIFLGWFAVNRDGTVVSSGHPSGFSKPDGWPAVLLQSRLRGLECFAMVFAENENGSLSSLIRDPVARQNLAYSVAAATWEYDGVLIDFEGLGRDETSRDSEKEGMNAFIDSLKGFISEKPLAVALPPLNGSFKGYDHKHIGEKADFIVLMAYAYEDPKSPSPTAPWDKVDEAIRMEKEVVPGNKILLGIPAYGTLYKVSSDGSTLQSRPAAKDNLGRSVPASGEPTTTSGPSTGDPSGKSPSGVPAGESPEATEPIFKPEYSCEYLEWKEGEVTYRAFVETRASLEARLLLASRYGLRGTAVWRLGILPEGWWESVTSVAVPKRPQ